MGVRWQGAEPVYRTVMGVAITLFAIRRWRVRITGWEHIPAEGPAVLAANHIGLLDFVFIGYGAREQGRLVRFMARQEAFTSRLTGPLMRAMRHIPVDRDGAAASSLALAEQRLREGEVVGLHPEGTISRAFVLRPGKTGAARLAMATGAPLVPTAVWGTQRLLAPRRPRFPSGVDIDVRYGPPLRPQPGDDPVAVTLHLMRDVGALVDAAIATYPQQPDPDDAWWMPAHLGGAAPTLEEFEEEIERRRVTRRLS